MALVTRKNMSALSAISTLLQNPQVYNQALNTAAYLGRQIGSAIGTRPNTLTLPNVPQMSGGPMFRPSGRIGRSSRTRGSRRRKSRRVGDRAVTNVISGSNPRPGVSLKPRLTFTFVYTLTSNAGGACNLSVWLGYKNTAFSTDLQSISGTQYKNLATLYQWQTLHKVWVEFIPQTAYTNTGIVASAIYPDPTVVPNASALQTVIEKETSAMSDVKEPHCYVWVPTDQQQREAKEASDASTYYTTATALGRDYAPATIGFYAATNIASATVGFLKVTIDMTFSGLL